MLVLHEKDYRGDSPGEFWEERGPDAGFKALGCRV